MTTSRCVLVALAVLWGGTAAAAERAPDEISAWRSASLQLFNPALDAFGDLARELPDAPRAIRLGRALTLLNSNPKTPGNVEKAAAMLEELQREDSRDEAGIVAAYSLARITQWHRMPNDPASALRQFEALAQEHPTHFLGQLSLVKALVIRLYEPVDAVEKIRRLEGAEAIQTQLSDKRVRAEYHQCMAIAGTRFEMAPRWRLRHLVGAIESGVLRPKERKDFALASAETARICGERETALRYYGLFLELAQRDERRDYVSRRYEAYQSAPEGS